MTNRPRAADARQRALVILAIVVLVLLLAVAFKYWPPGISEAVQDFLNWISDETMHAWRRIGGRWLTISALVVALAAGLLVMRRNRFLGVTLIEVGIAAAAVVALLQPGGW